VAEGRVVRITAGTVSAEARLDPTIFKRVRAGTTVRIERA
jgi:hypothetical protein